MLPAITTHAKIAFRHLKPEARAEAVQEVVCNAMQAFVRLVQLKKTSIAYPTVLARYGVRRVKDHRKVGGHLNVRDVLSPYCQAKKGTACRRLDQTDHSGRRCRMKIEIIVSPNGQTTVQTLGFVGPSCRDASKFIEQALGQRTSEMLTAEFHQVQAVEQQQKA
jgi:hypothetical protein